MRGPYLLVPRIRENRYCLAVFDDSVDDSVLVSFLRGEEVVALHVLRDFLDVLPAVVRDDLLEPSLQRDRLARRNLDVGRLSLEAARHLVDQNLGIRQRESLPCRTAAEEQR